MDMSVAISPAHQDRTSADRTEEALLSTPQGLLQPLQKFHKVFHIASYYTAVTRLCSAAIVLIVTVHHSGKFARTIASAKGGHTAFPHRATCLSFG